MIYARRCARPSRPPTRPRKQLADIIDGYAESFPDEFFWAIGPQAPSLLYHLMLAMDDASHDEESKPGPRLRLIPGGNE
jgi:hypothetical protein